MYIGVGASPAGPVLAGPLFQRYNKICYKNIKKLCARLAGPLQSPSYAPDV